MLDHETDYHAAQATLDAMAEAWALAADLPGALAQMLSRDDRARRLEAFIKLVWSEGALAGYRRMTTAQIADTARGSHRG